MKKKLKELWCGRIPLVKTFWLYCTAIPILFAVFLSLFFVDLIHYSISQGNLAPLYIFRLCQLFIFWPYSIITIVGLWRSANHYTGTKAWEVLAKIYVVLLVLFTPSAISDSIKLFPISSSNIEQEIPEITGKPAPEVIERASEKDKQAAQAEINELRQYFRSKVDTVENIKWIRDKKTPEYFQKRTLYTYLGERYGYTWTRTVIGYETSSKPVSIDRIVINIDGEVHYITVDPAERQTERLSGGKTQEYIDLKLTPEIEKIMWKIANGKKIIVRCNGPQYYEEFTVSQAQKEALKHIWGYYRAKRVLGETIE